MSYGAAYPLAKSMVCSRTEVCMLVWISFSKEKDGHYKGKKGQQLRI